MARRAPTVRAILSDANIQGQIRALFALLETDEWRPLWEPLNLTLLTFFDLDLDEEASDRVIWESCQRERVVLLTANRNQDGPDSLETTIRTQNQQDSLPVLTLANADRVVESRDYAVRVIARLLEILMDIDAVRGAGRLYLP
jgi:hypothetical protein